MAYEWTYYEEPAENLEMIEELPADADVEITEADIAELEKLSEYGSEPAEFIEYGSDPAEIIESSQAMLAEAGVTYPEPSVDLIEVDVSDMDIPEVEPEMLAAAGGALATAGGAILAAAPWVIGGIGVSLLAAGSYRMIRNDIKRHPDRWQWSTYTQYFRSKTHDQTNTETSRSADSTTAAKPHSWEVITDHPCPGYYAKQC
jgi:hypothetical protein